MPGKTSHPPSQAPPAPPCSPNTWRKPSFHEIFSSEESNLLHFAFSFVKQRQTAEDLVQDAFLKLHSHWNQVDSPKSWLYRAVRNLALNHIRNSSHYSDSPPPDTFDLNPSPDVHLSHLEALGSLRLLLAELPEPDQTLVRLKYEQGLKYEQISLQTGLSVGNVGYKLHHALKLLADGLQRLGIDQPCLQPFPSSQS